MANRAALSSVLARSVETLEVPNTAGAVDTPPFPWQDRGTYHQVVELSGHRADSVLFDVSDPVLQAAAQAMGRATGTPAQFIRSGGSIPIVAELADRGIPTVVSGFALPDDRIHAPDESYRLRSLELGEASARELYQAFAALR